MGFSGGSVVENLPAMQETQETRVQSLGQEDPLKERMATYSSILAGKILWTEELGGLQSMRSQIVIRGRSQRTSRSGAEAHSPAFAPGES